MNLQYKFHRWVHGDLMWRKWLCNEEDQSYTKGDVKIVMSATVIPSMTIPCLDVRIGSDKFYVFPRVEITGGKRTHAEWRTRRDWRCAITRTLATENDYVDAALMPLEGLRNLLDALSSPEDVPALAGIMGAESVMEVLLKI